MTKHDNRDAVVEVKCKHIAYYPTDMSDDTIETLCEECDKSFTWSRDATIADQITHSVTAERLRIADELASCIEKYDEYSVTPTIRIELVVQQLRGADNDRK